MLYIMNILISFLVSRHQKVVVIIILAVVSSFWFYALFNYGDIDFGENVTRIVRESDRRDNEDPRMDNSIPVRQVNSHSSSTSRKKRETNGKNIAIEPAMEMTKSSQQIQFNPELAYFYGSPGSIDSYPMSGAVSGLPQFSPLPPVQQTYGNAFNPGYLPFQPNGQIACFLNPDEVHNPYAPFHCTYIPAARPPPMTYQYPSMSRIPDFYSAPRTDDIDWYDPEFPYIKPNPGYPLWCPAFELRCRDNSKCLPRAQWCDNKVDCPDASDENFCPCKDRLDPGRWCDGTLDCPDGEDEQGCDGCPYIEFNCHDRVVVQSNCFKKENICDGNSTCLNGRDEEDCSVLTKKYGTSLGVFPAGFFNGFLQRNYKGKWYHVCGRATRWAAEACEAKLGHLSKKPRQEMVDTPNNQNFGPFLLEDGRIVRECNDKILYVHCPDPGRAAMPINSRSKINIPNQDHSLTENTNSTSLDPIVSIVGGRPSEAGAWPFIVGINRNGRFYCGGAVVNSYWILSAAHCFLGGQHYYYEIEAGMLRRLSFSPAHQIRRLKSITIHEKFDPHALSYDIALLRMDEPLDFNEWVGPVTLPKPVSFSGWKREPSPGASCVAVGWGAVVEGGPDPDHLQEVDVPVVPCTHSRDRNNAEICAGYSQGGRDSCQGDSGGPLMCRDSNSEWYIGGVVSHGVGCARVNEPGAYTKVSFFVDWINDVINERPTPSTVMHSVDKCPGFTCHPPFNRCIPTNKRCDGVVDCLKAEDEENCPPPLIQTATNFLKGLFGHKRQVELEKPEV